MKIVEIKPDDEGFLEQFFLLPHEVYRHRPVWVPENRSAMRVFSDGAAGIVRVPLLALAGDKAVARLVCIMHSRTRDEDTARQGWMGYFEALDGYREHALELIRYAEGVLVSSGAALVTVPRTDNQDMGFLVRGYRLPQTVMTMYNPPYYPALFEQAGYMVKKRSLCFTFSRQRFSIPRLALPGNVRTRELDMDNLEREVAIFNRLQNEIFQGRDGYIPRTVEEDKALINSVMPYLNKDLVIFAGDEGGRPLGVVLCLPDFYQALKGEKITRARIVSIGVLPGWENKGVGKALGYHLMQNLLQKTEFEEAEASFIRSDNMPPQLLALKFGAKPGREFALLQKKLTS